METREKVPKNQTVCDFDVIVIGGGHAGIEAAHAAAMAGSRTLLATLEIEKIGTMPCNPAVGGVGKGHITYEISALGGLMPQLCTQTYLQVRMLNTRKGPAVQGLRLQIDKYAYSSLSQKILSQLPNLTLRACTVETILLEQHGTEKRQVRGVQLADGTEISAPTVIVTGGTYLNGKIHIGKETYAAGRRDEKAVTGLSQFFAEQNLNIGRLKTGTPPRLLASSLDFSRMEKQEADNLSHLFEFRPHRSISKRDCYITHTNENTHRIIRENLHQSGMYNGTITSKGPRYCPSLEDKVARFPTKTSHHVFVEPESIIGDEIYPNGLSTSLPRDVQEQYIHSIVGFEKAIITKPGYAVEYDFVLPHQLFATLETKEIEGLFLAGQINGTTGYEEAAGQGIIAGINAHQKAQRKEPFILDRTHSYLGVMIDDLITMSVDEPYRMFTSRAEHRLLLRQDNAFLRLMPQAHALGLIPHDLYQEFVTEKESIERILELIRTTTKHVDQIKSFGQDVECVKRFAHNNNILLSDRAALTVHAEIRYGPYIEREKNEIRKYTLYKSLKIPAAFSFSGLPGLSKELQEKLNRTRPTSIAEATQIPGMTPAAISLLIFRIKEGKEKS